MFKRLGKTVGQPREEAACDPGPKGETRGSVKATEHPCEVRAKKGLRGPAKPCSRQSPDGHYSVHVRPCAKVKVSRGHDTGAYSNHTHGGCLQWHQAQGRCQGIAVPLKPTEETQERKDLKII